MKDDFILPIGKAKIEREGKMWTKYLHYSNCSKGPVIVQLSLCCFPCFVLGNDITLVAHSRFVGLCLEAAEELQSSHSVSCEVSSCLKVFINTWN